MSEAQHEEAARVEEHAAAPDPDCTDGAGPCWSGSTDPADAQRHRDAAAAHRSAAAALRDAEDRACAGLSGADRDQSPFSHRADIASVSDLVEDVPAGHTILHQTVGATIVFRAVRGLTTEWLERVIECHLARNAGLGHDVPEMPDCPLVPMGVGVHVRSTGTGFAVDVRSDDEATAAEIVRRAHRLVSP